MDTRIPCRVGGSGTLGGSVSAVGVGVSVVTGVGVGEASGVAWCHLVVRFPRGLAQGWASVGVRLGCSPPALEWACRRQAARPGWVSPRVSGLAEKHPRASVWRPPASPPGWASPRASVRHRIEPPALRLARAPREVWPPGSRSARLPRRLASAPGSRPSRAWPWFAFGHRRRRRAVWDRRAFANRGLGCRRCLGGCSRLALRPE